jgi:hypothetical protein
MSVVENPETSGPSMRAAPRCVINEVVAIDERTSEIRFGDSEYILVPAPIDRTGASQWLASMRRVDSVELEFGMRGAVAQLKGANRVSKSSKTVQLSTALGLLDSGVRGQITIKRGEAS